MSLPIISAIGSIFSTWWTGRQKIKEAKVQATIAKWQAKAQLEAKKIDVEADWDIRALEASKESWKDELLTICIVGPYIASFIPKLQPYVKEGFQMINTLPYWWQVSFWGIIAASFGLRWWFGQNKLKVIQNKDQ